MSDDELGRFAALHHRAFRYFFIGGACASTGRWVNFIVIPKLIFDLTDGSATWIGISAFASFFPLMLMNPVAGYVSDRFQRVKVLRITSALQLVAAVGLTALYASGYRDHRGFVAVSFVTGMVFGIQLPVWQAFVSETVPRHLLRNAITLNSGQFNAARAVGPALGGFVFGQFGATTALAVYAAMQLVIVVALARIRVPLLDKAEVGDPFWSSIKDGARYAWSVPGIRIAIITVSLIGSVGSPMVQQVITFAEKVFEVEPVWFGVLISAQGTGAVLATPFIAGEAGGMRRSTLQILALLLYGGAIAGFAAAPVYWVGLVCLLLVGAAHLASASTLNSSVQLQTSEDMRSRVLALYLLGVTGFAPLTSLLIGYLIDAVAPRPVVFGMGVLMVIGIGFIAATGQLRAIDDDRAQPQSVVS